MENKIATSLVVDLKDKSGNKERAPVQQTTIGSGSLLVSIVIV